MLVFTRSKVEIGLFIAVRSPFTFKFCSPKLWHVLCAPWFVTRRNQNNGVGILHSCATHTHTHSDGNRLAYHEWPLSSHVPGYTSYNYVKRATCQMPLSFVKVILRDSHIAVPLRMTSTPVLELARKYHKIIVIVLLGTYSQHTVRYPICVIHFHYSLFGKGEHLHSFVVFQSNRCYSTGSKQQPNTNLWFAKNPITLVVVAKKL